jgi:nucleoside-diphosphate-sugar epimerase
MAVKRADCGVIPGVSRPPPPYKPQTLLQLLPFDLLKYIVTRSPVKMSNIVIIGGSGHVGTYLIPSLVELGHKVTNVSRGTAKPYRPHSAWSKIKQVSLDRKAAEADGTFARTIADLKPDIVIDMIAFDLPSVQPLVEALQGKIHHYIFCSTIWVYGHLTTVPATEAMPSNAFDDYGIKKAKIEAYLMDKARREGFPATSFRPGHIVGEGWIPVNPQGHFDPNTYSKIAAGEEICLPNLGLEMLHHVHADDCSRWVLQAIDNRNATIGECFNTVSANSLTLRGYAEAMYAFWGKESKISYKPLYEWEKDVEDKFAGATKSHVMHSPCASIEKSRKRIGYEPRYTSLEAVKESVRALIAAGTVIVPDQKN